jgi:hypothetical protein
MDNSPTIQEDTKKVFLKCGTCSHTYFHILNREFGTPKETEELASDPLAGGLMCGQQCGMLWGSALAVGAESFRRYPDPGQAIGCAITTTRSLIDSFSKRAGSANCREILGFSFTNPFGVVIYMLKALLHGGLTNSQCFNLASDWAPEAIQSAAEGLAHAQTDFIQKPVSCASEVAKKMGATDEEAVTVAGLAGGMGLSGKACGALGAAIWMNALARYRNQTGDTPLAYNNESTKRILKAFNQATGSEILCHQIAGRAFKTIDEHTEFIQNEGCAALIDVLAQVGT